MMKKNYYVFMAKVTLLIAGAAIVACSDNDDPIMQSAQDGQHVCKLIVSASLGSNASTRGLTLDGADIKAYWETGDKVTVYDGDTSIGTLIAEPDVEDDTKATLTGTLTGTVNMESAGVTLRYKSNVTYRLWIQDGTLENIASTACDYATTDAITVNSVDIGTTETVVYATATFHSQQPIVKFTLQDAAGQPIMSNGMRINVNATQYNVDLATPSDELFVALPASANAKFTFFAHADNSTKSYRYSKTSVTFAKGNYYPITVKMTEVSAPAGAEAVDLGLESGTKWANKNVGAQSLTGEGTHYAWGEVFGMDGAYSESPNDEYKNSFGMSTQSWAYPRTSGANQMQYRKYNSTDRKTVLEPLDDAASANWGEGWHTPTKEQWQELLATKGNTTDYLWTWCDGSTVKYNESSTPGWKIEVIKTGTLNGNTLFLPVAGHMQSQSYQFSGSYYSNGSDGHYLSSTVSGINAWAFHFHNIDATPGGTPVVNTSADRWRGFSVRPVKDE